MHMSLNSFTNWIVPSTINNGSDETSFDREKEERPVQQN